MSKVQYYGHIIPKIIVDQKLCDSLHIDPIGPHIKSIIQNHPGDNILHKEVSVMCMNMI